MDVGKLRLILMINNYMSTYLTNYILQPINKLQLQYVLVAWKIYNTRNMIVNKDANWN